MQRQLRLTFLGGLIILLSASFSPSQDAKKGEKDSKTPNFYPIEVGNTWHYRVNLKGKDSTLTMTVAKHEKINGETVARLETPNVDANEHVLQSDKGVFRYRTNGGDVTPPFKLLAYPIKVGANGKARSAKTKEEE